MIAPTNGDEGAACGAAAGDRGDCRSRISRRRRFRRRASCARPTSISDRDSEHQSEHRRPGQSPMSGSADQSATSDRGSPASAAGIGLRLHPYVRYSPNLYPPCNGVSGDAACSDQPAATADGGGGRGAGRKQDATVRAERRRAGAAQPAHASPTNSWPRSTARCRDAQADELARRHGLVRLQSQNFPLIGAHHRPVPRHRPPRGGDREPRICHRRQRSLGAAELPLCAAGAEGST